MKQLTDAESLVLFSLSFTLRSLVKSSEEAGEVNLKHLFTVSQKIRRKVVFAGSSRNDTE